MTVAPAQFPRRYRRSPISPQEHAAHQAERNALLEHATHLDAQQQALAAELAAVRTALAEIRVVMWPRVEPKDIVHGFRHSRVNGPPPIPPVARDAVAIGGKHLRHAALAMLAIHKRPMKLVEIHRALHLQGFAIDARFPVKRLADALGYETQLGRADRVARGVYKLGSLTPGERRRINA